MRKKNWHTVKKSKMKGNFWRKIFRKGYNGHGYHSAQLNGTMSKQDANNANVNEIEEALKKLNTGASLRAEGILIESPASGQAVEVTLESLTRPASG